MKATKYTKYTSKQQIFNKVWKHFITEKNPQSIVKDSIKGESCKYYSKSGGCAIGCLISNNRTKKLLDSRLLTRIEDVRWGDTDIINRFISPKIETIFLERLQMIHDSYFGSFEHNMRALAEEYRLKVPKTK